MFNYKFRNNWLTMAVGNHSTTKPPIVRYARKTPGDPAKFNASSIPRALPML
jgi:hypothetical protein